MRDVLHCVMYLHFVMRSRTNHHCTAVLTYNRCTAVPQELCHATLSDALWQELFHEHQSYEPYLDRVLHILLDVAKGMAHIHEKNVIHG